MNAKQRTKREILLSLLKLTRDGPAEERLVVKDSKVPSSLLEKVLRESEELGLIRRKLGFVDASRLQRVNIALQILRLGGDLERLSKHLSWEEFENFSVVAFETSGYTVQKHFRFKWAGRRWEIDILGRKNPYVVCVDCKHIRRKWSGSTVAKAAEMQKQRVLMLSEALPSLREVLKLASWKKAYLIPVILSLVPAPFKFHKGVPVVPILQLQDFINELPAHMDLLTFKLVDFEL